ncbi:hypothetical protein BAE44_0011473 [Dichanthelium oligosanthes]|uniref:DUF1618 domain-containing protein n=1 Tax=Dichanthelium oligosanthes TaxID=888268 RepID=A0A1E5VQW2_9POAL|nr:hypothetical protein BAE44_0011473 [Dichanthelium oligosanthes]
METIRSSTGLSATAGKRCRRKKVRKLTEGGGVEASHGESGALVQLEDPNGSEGRDPSVYLAVCGVYWFNGSGYYPLHKADVASSSSGDSSSSPRAHAASRVANLRTDVGCKTFVTLQSRWIVCVGGDPGGTVIFDTETAKVTLGPTLVAAKLFPVVAAVGYRVYALSMTPDFIKEPDFVPWFEVLDLSKAVDAEGDLTLLDRCSWEALPCPLCYPRKLPTADYLTPPIFTVTSYVVVGHYIILTLYEPGKTYGVRFNPEEFHKVTYGFDTESEEWHKVDDDACLPWQVAR